MADADGLSINLIGSSHQTENSSSLETQMLVDTNPD